MNRALLLVHRWLGVALCGLFLTWFPSGIAIMYFQYPEVTNRDRLDHGSNLDAATIRIQPTDIFATLGVDDPPVDIRLQSYNGRPIYRYTDSSGESVVYADTGDFLEDDPVPPAEIAARWVRLPVSDAKPTAIQVVDQWTLQLPVASLQPLWKFSFPTGDDVYVSEATGDVVQHTTRAGRIGAYLGPVMHWLYFTPLRSNGPMWSRIVIWSSALATISAIVGVVLGAWIYGQRRRVPYAGQKRWHMLLGLVFGIAAVTWAFSGMLSMDPFPSLSGVAARRAGASAAIPQALRARPTMTSFLTKSPREALEELEGLQVRELAYAEVAGEAVYLATLAGGATRVVPVTESPRHAVDRTRLVNALTEAAQSAGGATITEVDEYDLYYLDRRGLLPLPVLLVQLNDADATRYYVDPVRGALVGSYSSARWVNRWLYRGLHSLDFPWLYRWRPLWDIAVIAFMLGGTALSFTSVVLAWRVLGRKLRRIALAPHTAQP